MNCKRISVSNFRNIENESIEFSDGVNILIGENAQGKTNLLEAVYYISVGKSFRANHTNEIIRFGQDSAKISLDFCDSLREQNITMSVFRDRKRNVEKNGVRIDRLSDIIGSFRAVLFCPEHLSLIKEGPAMRRNYLDIAISRMRPIYMHSLQKYNYILKQRNMLIKKASEDRKTFDATVEFWSGQLAHEAAVISKFRLEYLKNASEHVSDCFYEMTGDNERPELIYMGSSRQPEEEYDDIQLTENKYLELLSENHEREIYAGATLWGIHKDDIEIKLNSKPARLYASQGQQRSLALALKLAEGEICFKEFGDRPVYLFDDVLSELDFLRREYLLGKIHSRQVIITSCEQIDIESAKKIKVKEGKYFY